MNTLKAGDSMGLPSKSNLAANLKEVVDTIDAEYGAGYAIRNPDLVASLLRITSPQSISFDHSGLFNRLVVALEKIVANE